MRTPPCRTRSAEVTADPDGTAETALAVMFSWQPGTDAGPAAAVARALPYLGR